MAWPEIHQLGTLSVLFGFMYQLVLLIVSKTIDSAAGHDATLYVCLLFAYTASFQVPIGIRPHRLVDGSFGAHSE